MSRSFRLPGKTVVASAFKQKTDRVPGAKCHPSRSFRLQAEVRQSAKGAGCQDRSTDWCSLKF